MLPILRVNVEVLVAELKEHGILLDESIVSSLMSSLLPPMDTIDELHYVMYRLGKKESGLQIFYRCLRGTQDESPGHRLVADRIESEGILLLQHRWVADMIHRYKNHVIAGYYIDTLFTCFFELQHVLSLPEETQLKQFQYM